MTQIDLTGAWSLADSAGDYACTLDLPGDGISALHDAGLIPDPYFGRNEYDLRWICERDWVATRQFNLTDPHVDLVLSRMDTVVTVRVNDTVVLKADNAFRDYRVSLGDVAFAGQNTISLTFHSPVVAGKALFDAHDFDIPWSRNCPIPYGNFLRKPACDFGWDWNIALAPFGVYGAITVMPSDAPRIDRLAIHQDHSDGVVVHVSAYVSNHTNAVTLTFDGQNFSARPVHGVCTFRATVKNPKLWWPAGQGDQPLYDLEVTAGPAKTTRRIGLRKMELVTAKDEAGLSFVVRVNGRDVFCKGANWIPADALPGRISIAKTTDLLQSAVDANMNMIRIWGGGRYEPTSFYDTCDELGLLVWQDFMFACNLYPSDRSFIANVRTEVQDNVARMHHHACIALWCGDNELVGALDWYDVSKLDRDRYLVNYDRLNRAIEDVLLETDPYAIWWPSSPTKGPLNFGDSWHDDGSGDMHFWSVWHEGRDFDHYRDVAPRFCSEFGFQSYPTMNAIRNFTAPEDRNIAAPVLESHQKNDGGNARIAETMFRYFRWPEAFDDFVYLSQVQQALAIKTAVTHWRSLKPHCMGTLIWQLNDTWPVCSWASLDYGGDWKLMHHAARDFFAPVICTAVPNCSTTTIRAINDMAMPAEVEVTLRAVTPDGATRELGQVTAAVGAEAVDIFHVEDLGPQEMLLIDWQSADGHGREVHAPQPYKSYDLMPAGLSLEIDGAEITIAAKGLGLFVFIEADIPGRFSANNFDLLPGESRSLRFDASDPTRSANFTLRDLHSATYGKTTT
ncbi:beta-mannosidase [Cognatiyoonia koreensis]|uniref:beta-mannosidase n=1 Tax=Cognatiyoonia koreensis TaxID=364200 RepID=A0A1I0RW30_9RHOB|nr:glycoside hydrolase family 2 protein [Cognatiyoonia koreensis]SEW45676.1 beta-mannosidase [Cognatiyoonia koreensis]